MRVKCLLQNQCHNIGFGSTLKSNVLTSRSLYITVRTPPVGHKKLACWQSDRIDS